ncbi:MAG: hypothetical protein AAGF12_36295 [Myxococcota bacterium]
MARIATLGPILVLGALALGVGSPAAAQRSVDIERFNPALDTEGFLGLQASRTPGPGRWNFEFWLNYSLNPLLLNLDDDTEQDVIDSRLNGHFLFQIGLFGRLALGVEMPLTLYQDVRQGVLLDELGEVDAVAAGDPRILARYRFLGEDSTVERERNEGYGVAVQAGVSLPIGSDDAFTSEEGVTTELSAIADFHLLGAGVGAQIGWRHRFEPQTVLGARFRDELEVALGLKLPIPVTRDLVGILEARWITDLGSPGFNGPINYVEGDLGVRIRRGDITLTGVVGTGFTGAVGAPSFRTMLAIGWNPRVLDSDGDGVPDDSDQCEFLPEDFDGFEDEDGCLDPDNDNDLIPDHDDRCPNEEAEEFRDEDEDGCTDPLVDGDNDGVEDSQDSCPGQAEDQDGFQDEDGCPEPDNDQDEVLDAQDACPTEAEDRDGFQDDDGCPDVDNDGDGRPDSEDECPNAVEDQDGFDDDDGCPDPDNDRDGVVDAEDQCADEREVINGVDDDDGCADRGGRVLVRLGETQWTGRLPFERDQSLGTLGEATVDQLARLLISRFPDRFAIHIGGIAGSDEEKAAAAATRTQTLQAALIARRVPAERFTIEVDARNDSGLVVRPAPAPSAPTD